VGAAAADDRAAAAGNDAAVARWPDPIPFDS
jgi:hypothetical protein